MIYFVLGFVLYLLFRRNYNKLLSEVSDLRAEIDSLLRMGNL